MYKADTTTWYLERMIRLIAGVLVLGSSLLGYFISPKWFLLGGFVGVMLSLFALTGFCPMGIILNALGARSRCS
jgi:fatty acid desaturase